MQKACYLHLEKKKPQDAINNVNWKSENTSPGIQTSGLNNKKIKSFCFLRLTLYICIVVYAIIVSCPNKDNKNKTG